MRINALALSMALAISAAAASPVMADEQGGSKLSQLQAKMQANVETAQAKLPTAQSDKVVATLQIPRRDHWRTVVDSAINPDECLY